MKCFINSIILDQYEYKDQITQYPTAAEFANRYDAVNFGGELREDILCYLRNLNRLLGGGIGDDKRGNAETYGHTRKPGIGKNYNDSRGMARSGHFRDVVMIGLRVSNCAWRG